MPAPHRSAGLPPRPDTFSRIFIALCLTALACADVGPPPGGPEDKTGPHLIGSVPLNEAVNVPLGDKISLFFSERIVRPTGQRAVYVSPRQAEDPEISWKKDRIEVTLADSFQVNQTYVVAVSASVADLRRNKLDSATIVAFSTGAALDTGSVSGSVWRADNPAAGIVVALYDPSVVDSTVYDSILPAHVTTTDQSGHFTFRYLPPQSFHLVAFEDKNRNERLNPFRESFAVSDRPVVAGGRLALDDLFLRMISTDTTRPAILSATVTADGLIRTRLSRAIPTDQLGISHALALTTGEMAGADSMLYSFDAAGFLESNQTETSIVTAYFGAVPEGEYSIRITYDSTEPALTYEGLEIAPHEDKKPPAITLFEPDDKPLFVNQLRMRMTVSEPLDTTTLSETSFLLWHTDSNVVPLTYRWEDPFHLFFEPRSLKSGLRYRLDISEFDLVDKAGNPLGDSVLTYSFRTLADDSLGQVSGEVAIGIPDKASSAVLLSFDNISTKQTFETTAENGKFLQDLPAGKYLLSGFLDSNGNGELDNGSLIPFEYAETFARFADTIAVRARFETTGILFEFK